MRVLYVIACGAGPAPEVGRLVDQAQRRRWDVHLIATPAAVGFLDIGRLEAQTGHAVRSEHRRAGPGPARSLPRANAIVVAPATYNTINKWAMGVSDNYALDILAESVGLGIPTVVLPFVNAGACSASRVPAQRRRAPRRSRCGRARSGRVRAPPAGDRRKPPRFLPVAPSTRSGRSTHGTGGGVCSRSGFAA
jgi:flavoprotein